MDKTTQKTSKPSAESITKSDTESELVELARNGDVAGLLNALIRLYEGLSGLKSQRAALALSSDKKTVSERLTEAEAFVPIIEIPESVVKGLIKLAERNRK